MQLLAGQSADTAQGQGQARVTATALVEVVRSLTASLAPLVEQSCLTLCHEIEGLRAEDKTAAQRMVVALQFQDRHTQAVQDIGVLLQQLRYLTLGKASAVGLEAVCGSLQLCESRELLRAAASGSYQCGICIMRGGEPGAIDLF